MTEIVSKLHAKHEVLWAGIESLRETANLVDLAPIEALNEELAADEQFLRYELIPHARAEEEILYRAYDALANSPWASDTMRHDHRQVEQLTDELSALRLSLFMDPPTEEQKLELRRLIYGLYAILKLHISKEESLLLPRLEAGLTQETADQMLLRMDEMTDKLREAVAI